MTNPRQLVLLCILTTSALLATTWSAGAAPPLERRTKAPPVTKAEVAPTAILSFLVKNMAGSATLTRGGEPLGDIVVDESDRLGQTFATFEVPAGEHELVAIAAAGDGREVALTVAADAGEAVFIEVWSWSKRRVTVASRTPLGDARDGEGKLVVTSAFEGTAYVDGDRHKLTKKDDAPATLELELPAGPHYVAGILEQHPFKRQAHGVAIVAGETTTVTLYPGSALLESPQVAGWATIRVVASHVDGMHSLRIGDVTPAVVMRGTDGAFEPLAFRLPPGKHTVEVLGPLTKVGDVPIEVAAHDQVDVALAAGGELVEERRDNQVDTAPEAKPSPVPQRRRNLRLRKR